MESNNKGPRTHARESYPEISQGKKNATGALRKGYVKGMAKDKAMKQGQIKSQEFWTRAHASRGEKEGKEEGQSFDAAEVSYQMVREEGGGGAKNRSNTQGRFRLK